MCKVNNLPIVVTRLSAHAVAEMWQSRYNNNMTRYEKRARNLKNPLKQQLKERWEHEYKSIW